MKIFYYLNKNILKFSSHDFHLFRIQTNFFVIILRDYTLYYSSYYSLLPSAQNLLAIKMAKCMIYLFLVSLLWYYFLAIKRN